MTDGKMDCTNWMKGKLMHEIKESEPDGELFNVVQFFPDGTYEYVRRNVDAKQAVDAAYHYTHSVGAMAGVTQRVIITDAGDSTCFEWRFNEGVVFPEQIKQEQQRDYSK